MNITMSQAAEITLFVTNAVVMIISIGTYWRMTRYEQSNHLHIVNALRETRDAGLEMKVAAHELMRTAAGGHGGGGTTNFGPNDLQSLEELTQLVRQLLESRQLWSGGADPDHLPDEHEAMVHWPSHAKDMSNDLMNQLQQRHKNEVDRLLAQRRRTQQELDSTRERLEEINKLLNAMRLRVAQHAQVDVNGLKSKLENTRHQVQELQSQLDAAKMRALEAETKLARAQQNAGAGSKEADKAQAEQFKAMADEVAHRQAQLAEANKTIAKLRDDLHTLASAPEQASESEEWRQARSQMEREIAQLKTRTDELEDALKRNLVEKDFIEEHYLKEARKNRLDEAAALPSTQKPPSTPAG